LYFLFIYFEFYLFVYYYKLNKNENNIVIDFKGFLDISKNIKILQEFSLNYFITLVIVILIYQGLNNF
jgi:hypothetical protein